MNKLEEYYNQIVEDWRLVGKGRGTINFGPSINPLPVVLGVLYNVFEKHPDEKVLIIVDKVEDRNKVINYLTHTDIEQNNKEFDRLINNRTIRILTIDLLKSWAMRENFYLSIFIGVNDYSQSFYYVIYKSKFNLVCLTADTSSKSSIYSICPLINTNGVNNILSVSTNTPVEEIQLGVDITKPEDIEQLKKYDDYLRESMLIFGTFDRINLALRGEPSCNVSAIQFCTDLAKSNGWSDNLDMSIEHNKMIDSYFNPITIQERAKITYDIRIKRSQLITDNNSKLDSILKICEENKGKKILIINKTSEFAKLVTDYLNSKLLHYCNGNRFYDACYNYHENVDDCYDVDDRGERIKVKSGKLKGTFKIIKGKAQMSRAESYFNSGYTSILSTNNAPCKDLAIQVDLLIITSPLCESVENYLYRLSNVDFSQDLIKVVKIYCKGTLEERRLEKDQSSSNHTIVNNCEKSLQYDENLGSIVVC